jgi:hypothetical protein
MTYFCEISYIYALVDPRDPLVARYIGKADNPADRLNRHCREARLHSRPIHCWIRKLGREGIRPIMHVLQATGDWESAERAMIAEAKENGAPLLNVAIGGAEPHCSRRQRQANARHATSARPKNIMLAYRKLESLLRGKSAPPRERTLVTIALFRATVERHRAAGTLQQLDERVGRCSLGGA